MLVVLLGVGATLSPALVGASAYTWNGQTFTSQAEMYTYIRAYIKTWKELHGSQSLVSTPVSQTSSTQIPTSSTGATVRSGSALDVTPSTARLTARFERGRSKTLSVWFEYGTDWRSLWFATAREVLDRDFGSKVYDRIATNLRHDTRYYYRAVGEDEYGARTYGNLRYMETAVDTRNTDSGIRVSTGSARDVRDNRATLTGSVRFSSDTSGSVWFEYGDSVDDLYRKTPVMFVSKANNDSALTHSLRSLEDETTYYFRVVGYDTNGVKNYGTTNRFVTPKDIVDEKPKVTTGRVTDVTEEGAVVGGSVRMNDFRNGIVFVVYGEDQALVRAVSQEANRYSRITQEGDALQKRLLDGDEDGDGEYTFALSDLDLGTAHYYAVGVEYRDQDDNYQIILGSVSSFTTKKPR